MNNEWIFWLVTTAVLLLIGIVGFFLKKLLNDQAASNQQMRADQAEDMKQMRTDLSDSMKQMRNDFTEAMQTMQKSFQAAQEERDKRMEKLENRLQDALDGLPYKFTQKDDFVRAMNQVNNKLDKVLDRLSGINSQE